MKKNEEKCDLKSCFFCRNCLKDWLPVIESHRQTIFCKKGASLFREGDPVSGMYFLYKGRMKIHKKWGEEKQLILHFGREGDMIGYRGFGKEKVYTVTATALEATTLCFIETSTFESSLQINHRLTRQLMEFYANELQNVERRMGNLVHMAVIGRVAETILMLIKEFGQNQAGIINITLTKQDLAAYAGTTYETFSRMLNLLENDGIIKLKGKQIEICKQSALEKLSALQ